MSTDFRALCAELVEQLQRAINDYGFCLEASDALMHRARAALAQQHVSQPYKLPKPVAPTDDELWAVGNDDFRANCYPTDAIYYARAVLARWGTPAIAAELEPQ